MAGECKIIGITGGIGSGKSVVSRILRLNSFIVYDCDSEAKGIMECNLKVAEAIRDLLGERAYCESGTLDRGFVASEIFNDEEKLKGMNRIVHGAVREDFIRRCEDLAEAPGGLRSDKIFCESAILATAKMETICDEIWLITAPEDERVERVIKRSGLKEREIRVRMETQKEEFDRLPMRKTIEIVNDGSTPILEKILKLVNNKLNITEQICLEKF